MHRFPGSAWIAVMVAHGSRPGRTEAYRDRHLHLLLLKLYKLTGLGLTHSTLMI